MNGAQDMVIDHNMVVTQLFGRLGKRLDRPCITAKLDLRINHTSFHRQLPLFGSTGRRNKGASVSSVVKAHTVIESVASKLSSWTMTTGRGLPAYSLPPATVQMSPRLIHPANQKPHR